MRLIVCTDNSLGISFNGRRVSQDEMIIKAIKNNIGHAVLLCSTLSEKLFWNYKDIALNVVPSDNYLKLANDDTYVFYEGLGDLDTSKIKEIIHFNFNRDYPSDKKLCIDLSSYFVTRTSEFKGKSHDLITEIHYERGE